MQENGLPPLYRILKEVVLKSSELFTLFAVTLPERAALAGARFLN